MARSQTPSSLTVQIEKMPNSIPAGAGKLLDAVIAKIGLKNDAALSRVLEVAPPVISKLRHGHLQVGANLLIRLHEESGMSIRELKAYLVDENVV